MLLSELQKSLDELVSQESILECIRLKRLYIKAKDEKLDEKARIEILIESLLVATAYEERLVSMKINCKSILNKIETVFKKKRNEIVISDPNFVKKRKCDQDTIVASKLEKFVAFQNKAKNYNDMINDSLDYVRSAQFNIKAVLNVLKDQYLDDK